MTSILEKQAKLGVYAQRFDALSKKPANEQCRFFLTAFFVELQTDNGGADFNDVLAARDLFNELAGSSDSNSDSELNGPLAHKFLEDRKQAETYLELQRILKIIDLNNNGRMAFVEYCVFQWNKSIEDLFKATYADTTIVDKAIAEYVEAMKEQVKFEAECARLEEKAKSGGVAGGMAANQLESLKNSNRDRDIERQVLADTRRRKAIKAWEKASAKKQKDQAQALEDKKRQEDEQAAATRATKRSAFLGKFSTFKSPVKVEKVDPLAELKALSGNVHASNDSSAKRAAKKAAKPAPAPEPEPEPVEPVAAEESGGSCVACSCVKFAVKRAGSKWCSTPGCGHNLSKHTQ